MSSNTASFVSRALVDGARAESIAWKRFSAAQDGAEFWAAWLGLLCVQIDRASGGLLLLGPDEGGGFTPAAVWPDASHDLQHLGAAAGQALAERRGVVLATNGGPAGSSEQPAQIGYPIEVGGVLHGAVVVELAAGADAGLQRALRMVHWSSAWLVDHFRKQALESSQARLASLGLVMGLVATATQQRRLQETILAMANELATQLGCERVSIGLHEGGRVVVRAISNTAVFDAKMGLVRRIGEAMDEAIDLDDAVVFPSADATASGAACHVALAREVHAAGVCSVPLQEGGAATGVITLERSGKEFDAGEVELCRAIGEVLGPVLALKRHNERGALARTGEAARAATQLLLGPGHPGAKLTAVLAAAIVAFFSLVTATYHVSAKTVIEGAVQRAIVAPFEGHIAQSLARAGDSVVAGQVLSRLDDRELKLEQARLVSERDQVQRRQRQAVASQDRPAMMVLAAQVAQSDAQIALVEDKLARATQTAPFDGVIVTGDLHQLLGAPVEQGKLLFQVAPLDAYRIILDVDERDIADVRVGQGGQLALAGLPGERMEFTVRQITSVSTPQDGRNYFRVEAGLPSLSQNGPSARLRPGMEGVGKIEVGEHRLIWIWTHSLVDWLRLWAWRVLP